MEISVETVGTGGKKESSTADIKVFKPKLYFKDLTVWKGEETPKPESLKNRLVKTEWKHGTTGSTDEGIVMSGNEPTPELKFEIPQSAPVNGLIATKKDIPVTVIFTLGSYEEKLLGPGFQLKVKTCELTIKKKNGKTGETYLFNIRKGSAFYMTISLTGNGSVTIYDLPVGTYSAEDERAWSWRNVSGFNGVPTGTVKLIGSEAGSRATLTSTNTGIKNNKWLSHNSETSKNSRVDIALFQLNPAWAESKKEDMTG